MYERVFNIPLKGLVQDASRKKLAIATDVECLTTVLSKSIADKLAVSNAADIFHKNKIFVGVFLILSTKRAAHGSFYKPLRELKNYLGRSY